MLLNPAGSNFMMGKSINQCTAMFRMGCDSNSTLAFCWVIERLALNVVEIFEGFGEPGAIKLTLSNLYYARIQQH